MYFFLLLFYIGNCSIISDENICYFEDNELIDNFSFPCEIIEIKPNNKIGCFLGIKILDFIALIDHTFITEISNYNIIKNNNSEIPTIMISFPLCSLQLFIDNPPYDLLINVYKYLVNDFNGITFSLPLMSSQSNNNINDNNFLNFPNELSKALDTDDLSTVLLNYKSTYITTDDINKINEKIDENNENKNEVNKEYYKSFIVPLKYSIKL